MTNQPDAVPPDNSTADLGDDPMDGSDGSEGMGQGNSISLSQDQAKQAGIHDPKAGDEYTVTFKIDDTSDGISATIMDGSAKKADDNPNDMDDIQQTDADRDESPEPQDGEQSDATSPEEAVPPLAVKMVKKPKSRVLSPKEAGFPDDGKDL